MNDNNIIQHKFEKLKKWITNNGGHINNITLSNGIYGRSYVATSIINPDDILVVIPKSLWIDEYHSGVISLSDLEPYEKIMVALLLEIRKKDTSFYYPFIDLLPSYEEFNSHPLFECNFNLSSPKLTEWKAICPNFANNIVSLINFYYHHFYHIELFIHITEMEFKYVYLLYLTRNWHKFVPGADLFQHRCYKSLKGYDENNIFKIASGDKYSIGDDVYIDYGNKTNIELLFQYGFKTDIDFIPINLNSSYIDLFVNPESLILTLDNPNIKLIRTLSIIFNGDNKKAINFLLNYITEWKSKYFSYSDNECKKYLERLTNDPSSSIITKYLLEIGIQNHTIANHNYSLLQSIILKDNL